MSASGAFDGSVQARSLRPPRGPPRAIQYLATTAPAPTPPAPSAPLQIVDAVITGGICDTIQGSISQQSDQLAVPHDACSRDVADLAAEM